MNRQTVQLGLYERRTGSVCVDNYRDRGTHKSEECLPNLEADIHSLVNAQAQAAPRFDSKLVKLSLQVFQFSIHCRILGRSRAGSRCCRLSTRKLCLAGTRASKKHSFESCQFIVHICKRYKHGRLFYQVCSCQFCHLPRIALPFAAISLPFAQMLILHW